MTPPTFDRRLSRQIDLCHWQLDLLAGHCGLWTWLYRAWLRWRLRRLERRIPAEAGHYGR